MKNHQKDLPVYFGTLPKKIIWHRVIYDNGDRRYYIVQNDKQRFIWLEIWYG